MARAAGPSSARISRLTSLSPFSSACGNTFGATAFSSYGGFWLSYAFIVSPWTGISAAYEDETMFAHGVGFFLFGWFIFTFLMLIASLRSSIALSGVFFFLTITFLLLGINEFVEGTHCGIAGGAFGLITAFVSPPRGRLCTCLLADQANSPLPRCSERVVRRPGWSLDPVGVVLRDPCRRHESPRLSQAARACATTHCTYLLRTAWVVIAFFVCVFRTLPHKPCRLCLASVSLLRI